MFVVHTVNQLEEAVRVGAEEILVTGDLVSNLHEAYLLRTYMDNDSAASESSEVLQTAHGVDYLAQRSRGPVLMVPSLMMITGEYALLDSHLDSRSPSMILQRTTQH